ncbi:MAG: pantoate--beta-alanine ligase [Candidatus Aminicenantes bacterium]|nr:pantoate--beta-alanine ligase [Candidatus Aminicenantes bacterium]
MQIVATISEMKAITKKKREEGKRIGFVPTMGYLHECHLSLVRARRQENDVAIVSIFVNPIQFGPNEDFNCYPRDLERDRLLLEKEGVDYLFYPSVQEMYPPDYKTYVEVTELQDGLCGRSRPGHFRGVATVVLKLFNIISPDVAYFGQKDAQQTVIIRQMVRDLNLGIEIKIMPIVRDEDGLALSSRNTYLSLEERKASLAIPRGLQEAAQLIERGIRDCTVIKKRIEEIIKSEPALRIDYVEIVDPENLKPLERIDKEALIALAVYCGQTRLIDNLKIFLSGGENEESFSKI